MNISFQLGQLLTIKLLKSLFKLFCPVSARRNSKYSWLYWMMSWTQEASPKLIQKILHSQDLESLPEITKERIREFPWKQAIIGRILAKSGVQLTFLSSYILFSQPVACQAKFPGHKMRKIRRQQLFLGKKLWKSNGSGFGKEGIT